jgi:hypothetical protein
MQHRELWVVEHDVFLLSTILGHIGTCGRCHRELQILRTFGILRSNFSEEFPSFFTIPTIEIDAFLAHNQMEPIRASTS